MSPKLWQRAAEPELQKLGALSLRRFLLARDLVDVDRQIDQVRETVIALERTGALAAQIEAEGGATNGGAVGAERQSA